MLPEAARHVQVFEVEPSSTDHLPEHRRLLPTRCSAQQIPMSSLSLETTRSHVRGQRRVCELLLEFLIPPPATERSHRISAQYHTVQSITCSPSR